MLEDIVKIKEQWNKIVTIIVYALVNDLEKVIKHVKRNG